MSDYWMAIASIFLAGLTSTLGTVALRIATDVNSLALGIVCASFWGVSAAFFIYASGKGVDLGTTAAAMSCVGLATIQFVGIAYFGDTPSLQRLAGVGLVAIAIVLIAWPPTRG